MANQNEIIVLNFDSSSDNNSDSYSTSEDIDYDSPKPPKSLLKWYHYLSDEYKDNGRFWGSKSGCNESDVKPYLKDIEKAKACMLAKAQAELGLVVHPIYSSDDNNCPSIPRVPVYGPSVQGFLDYYGYENIEDCLSDFYFPSTDKEDTIVHTDSSDDSKGVSNKGPSITSIPKEGPSIARLSKEPIPKELLEWYGYDIVEDLPVAKKPIPKVIFKSPALIKECVLGLANVETWDNIVNKFGMRTPGRCADNLHIAFAACICTLHLQLAFASKHLHIAFADCICTHAI
ncbi:hypothetical protein Tco_0238571 [Tanacetum coccineum]